MKTPKNLKEKLMQLRLTSGELNRMLEDGSFYRLSFFKRYKWIRRIKKLYNSLLGPVSGLALKHILAAAAIFIIGIGGCKDGDDGDNPEPEINVSQDGTDIPNGSGSYDFADIIADGDNLTSTSDITFTIENNGTDDLTISGISLTSGDTGDFDLADNTSSPVAPSGSTTFTIRFDPLISGSKSATVTISNNDADEGNYSFTVNGTGSPLTPNFATPQENPFNLADVGKNSSPCFVDIDNDGDLDAFIGYWDGNTIYFENTGDAGSPDFPDKQTNPFKLAFVGTYSSPCFMDIDNDGDLDAFIGNWGGNIIYFENTGDAGSPNFPASQENPFNLAGVGSNSSPCFVDIDNDGDLDAFIGALSGNTYYFENTGNTGSPNFADKQENPFNLADVGKNSSPCFVDIDNDGDLDAFIGEYNGNTYYFENTVID